MASRIAYTKQAKSTSDLLAHLNAKGLIAPDRQKALHSLELIGYYRLLIYMRPLQDNRSRLFKSDVKFDDILRCMILIDDLGSSVLTRLSA